MVKVDRPSLCRARTSPVLSTVRNGICVALTWSQCTKRRLVAAKSTAPATSAKNAAEICSRVTMLIAGPVAGDAIATLTEPARAVAHQLARGSTWDRRGWANPVPLRYLQIVLRRRRHTERQSAAPSSEVERLRP